jgi:hypothetical protein
MASKKSSVKGVAAAAVAAFETVAVHPVLGLDVANDWLDRGAAAHLAADRGGDAAHLAADPDPELLLPIPCSQTHTAPWLCLCQCIRPPERTARRPSGRSSRAGSCGRAAGDPETHPQRQGEQVGEALLPAILR